MRRIFHTMGVPYNVDKFGAFIPCLFSQRLLRSDVPAERGSARHLLELDLPLPRGCQEEADGGDGHEQSGTRQKQAVGRVRGQGTCLAFCRRCSHIVLERRRSCQLLGPGVGIFLLGLIRTYFVSHRLGRGMVAPGYSPLHSTMHCYPQRSDARSRKSIPPVLPLAPVLAHASSSPPPHRHPTGPQRVPHPSLLRREFRCGHLRGERRLPHPPA